MRLSRPFDHIMISRYIAPGFAAFATLTLIFGDWRDGFFLVILVVNTAIGITQEVRAKRAVERLAALVAPTAQIGRAHV